MPTDEGSAPGRPATLESRRPIGGPLLAYSLRSKLTVHQGAVAWHFLVLPRRQAAEIRSLLGKGRRGWGSIPAEVTIRGTTWRTSLFPDTKAGSYLLPVKASVRKAEGLAAGRMVAYQVVLRP